jgi:hypothetical protein
MRTATRRVVMFRPKLPLVLVAAGVFAVGGCSVSSPGEGAAALCEANDGAEIEVPVSRTTDPSTLSVDQMRDYLVSLDAWLVEVTDAAGEASSAQYDDFRGAVEDFGAAVRGLRDGSGAEDAASVRAAGQEVLRTGQDLFESLGC